MRRHVANLFVICLVLGLLRILGMTNESFQAVAHLFVGGLFTAWGFTWRCCDHRQEVDSVYYLVMGVGLTLLEINCAIFFKVFAA